MIATDIDASDDPPQGQQQLRLFPDSIFYAMSGFSTPGVLRPSNADASTRAKAVLKRLGSRLKGAYARNAIPLGLTPASSLYGFCEKERIYYLIGLTSTDWLKEKATSFLCQA